MIASELVLTGLQRQSNQFPPEIVARRIAGQNRVEGTYGPKPGTNVVGVRVATPDLTETRPRLDVLRHEFEIAPQIAYQLLILALLLGAVGLPEQRLGDSLRLKVMDDEQAADHDGATG